MIESVAQNFRLVDDVYIAPVAGTTDHHMTMTRRHGVYGLHQAQVAQADASSVRWDEDDEEEGTP